MRFFRLLCLWIGAHFRYADTRDSESKCLGLLGLDTDSEDGGDDESGR
jgi:hypothetical protein